MRQRRIEDRPEHGTGAFSVLCLVKRSLGSGQEFSLYVPQGDNVWQFQITIGSRFATTSKSAAEYSDKVLSLISRV